MVGKAFNIFDRFPVQHDGVAAPAVHPQMSGLLGTDLEAQSPLCSC